MKEKTQAETTKKLKNTFQKATGANSATKGLMREGVLVAGVCFAGFLIILLTWGWGWWPKEQELLKTSTVSSFSEEAFGKLYSPQITEIPNTMQHLLEQIDTLKAHSKTEEKTSQEKQIASLQQQIEHQEHLSAQKDLELQKLQNQLEGQRLEVSVLPALPESDLLQKRIQSPLNPFEKNTSPPHSVETSPLEQRHLSGNELFAKETAQPVPVEQAQAIANPSHTILQGSVLQASLETAINTDMPGALRAVIAEDVHSVDGRRVLIPRGSKILGRYSDSIHLGQKRVLVLWERLLLPDYQTVTLSSYGGDRIGQSGVSGEIDVHFFERIGSAALISVIGISPALALSNIINHDNKRRTYSSSSYEETKALINILAQNTHSSLSTVTGDYLSRPPTITVQQGTTISIFVDRDLEIF